MEASLKGLDEMPGLLLPRPYGDVCRHFSRGSRTKSIQSRVISEDQPIVHVVRPVLRTPARKSASSNQLSNESPVFTFLRTSPLPPSAN